MNALPKRIHFVGIGGIGMSALAKVLLEAGYHVSGSDLNPSRPARKLAAAGATVHTGHARENLGDAGLVVVSSAVRAENPEIQAARDAGIPVIKRAELLGRVMSAGRGIAVAGTHGKTTTSSMIALLLLGAGLDPTILIGGEILALDSNARRGGGEWVVTEADEYDGSFLQLRPEIAVITNLEADHLDFYGTFERIQDAFRQFAARVSGTLALCADDQYLQALASSHTGAATITTYALDHDANWRAHDVTTNEHGGSDFSVTQNGEPLGTIRLLLPGRHNVQNALGAVAAAAAAGVPFAAIAESLGKFQGVRRRLEPRGEAGGVSVIDDYGHHPTEIRATLAALRQAHPDQRIVCLFQPHTYSRTKLLLNEFAICFGDADVLRVADIYAARERDEWGVRAEDLVAKIQHPDVQASGSVEAAAESIAAELRPGDVLLTIGAGDIERAGPLVLERLATR